MTSRAIDSTQGLYRDRRQAQYRSMETLPRLSTYTQKLVNEKLHTDYLSYLRAKTLRLGIEDYPQSVSEIERRRDRPADRSGCRGQRSGLCGAA